MLGILGGKVTKRIWLEQVELAQVVIEPKGLAVERIVEVLNVDVEFRTSANGRHFVVPLVCFSYSDFGSEIEAAVFRDPVVRIVGQLDGEFWSVPGVGQLVTQLVHPGDQLGSVQKLA